MDAEQGWEKLGPGVYRRRYEPIDVSVTIVEGDAGLLIVDTRRDPHEADELLRDVAARFDKPPRWVVNTHAHHDHSFGNQRFGPGSALDLPIYGHRNLAKHYAEFERPRLAAFADGTLDEPTYAWRDVVLTPPTHEVSEPTTLDLGGRVVELIPVAPAHTDGDLVVLVPHARVWLMGDIIEHTFPPTFGTGCSPLAWADSLDEILARTHPDDVLVPGHGDAVSPAYARRQSGEIRWVAEQVRAAHERGLDAETAVAARTDWPFPARAVTKAMRLGLAELSGAGA